MNGQKRAWRAIPLLAATLAAITLAFLAGCSSIKNDGAAKRDTAAPRSAANLISPHLPFGNPSEAGRAANNRLVLRRQFAASWNASKQIPNWVAWRLVASDIGDTERSQLVNALPSEQVSPSNMSTCPQM